MLENIISKLDDLSYSIDEKTVNQTVFVKPRYGLGYNGPSEFDSEEQAEHEKIRVELAGKNESLSLALQTSKDRTQFLEEKIKVLEQHPQQNLPESSNKGSPKSPKKDKKWFEGQRAHTMYVKQAQGVSIKEPNPNQRRKQEPFRPGKGKYGHVLYNRVCWHCGQNGHDVHDCKKKKELENSRNKLKPVLPYNTVFESRSVQENKKKNSPNTSPRKAKLNWVEKA